jgi:signal transduction histidine kinase
VTLSTRIGIGLLGLFALMVAVGAHQLAVIDDLRRENRQLTEIGLEAGKASLRLRGEIGELRDLTERLRVLGDPEYAAELERRRERTATSVERLRRLRLSPLERTELDELSERWAAYQEAAPKAEGRLLEWRSGRSLEGEVDQLDALRAVVARLMEASDHALSQQAEASSERVERARRLSLFAWLLSLLCAAGTSALVVRSIASSLRLVRRGAHRLGAGDLSYRVPVKGPSEVAALAADFNAMADRLEELEQLKRDFVSMVSHELKAPLASMQETLRLVLDGSLGPLDEEQTKILRLTEASADRLARMIHDLLDFACLEAGAMEFSFAGHDVVELMRGVLTEFAATLRNKGIRWTTEFPPGPVVAWADAGLLRQALENLVSNAVKFTPPEGLVEVAVHGPSGFHGPHSGPAAPVEIVAVTVSDTGPGIPDDHKQRIFDRFHRIDSTTKGSQGTGLGLAIAQGIVHGHGGSLSVEDRPGGGSRFVVVLRAARPRPGVESDAAPR